MFWNKRIYLETSNCRPAALCTINTPFSVQPASIRVVLFLEAVCACLHPSMRFVKPRTYSDKWCLLKNRSLHRYSSLLTLWGTAVCAIRSTAGFKNYEGRTRLLLAVSPCACSVPSPVQELTEATRSLLHLTHPSAVRRSTGTCARSSAGFLLRSEPALAASLGWRGPCRLGRWLNREEGGGWQQMCCRQWPPMQLWTARSCSPQNPWWRLACGVKRVAQLKY